MPEQNLTPEQRLTLRFVTAHPSEAARHVEALETSEAAALLGDLPAPAVAELLRQLVPYTAGSILAALPAAQAPQVVAALPSADILALLRALPPERRAGLLGRLDQQVAGTLDRTLVYPPGTAAGLADPFALTLPLQITVQGALEQVRRDRQRATYYLYVLDAGNRLAGVMTMKQLLAEQGATSLSTLCHAGIETVPADASLDELLDFPQWRHYHILPVVQRDGAYVGALRLRAVHANAPSRAEAGPAPFSTAMLQMWELYSLAGMGLMTGLAEGLTAIARGSGAPPPAPPPPNAPPPNAPPAPPEEGS